MPRYKKGSKGLAGGYGGYRHRYEWPDDRTRPIESETQRAERARRIADFLRRGGRIKRYPLAVAAGAGLVQVGGWAASAERTADIMSMQAELG